MEKTEQLRQWIRRLFAEQRLGVLSTQQGGQPYASLVAVAGSRDLRAIYFATPRSTRKFAYLSDNPRVAMLINSSANEAADIRKAMAVTALGAALALEGADRRRAVPVYLQRHPHMADFISAPTTALVQIEVARYILVRRFQNVMELHLN